MHARIAAFENRDVSRIDELVETVRDRQSSGAEIPDALGMYMLIDRSAGKMLGVSIFESAEALRAAEPIFDRMGDEIPEDLRGRRLSVDAYEVVIHEVAEGANAARMSILKGDPARIDDGIRTAVEDVLPEIREIDGWKGVLMLVNRSSGDAKVITLWESTDALAASESTADAMRRRTAEAAGETIAGVERYEVPLSFDRAPKLIGV
jgi:heme-degrading monooxygenase HmoA